MCNLKLRTIKRVMERHKLEEKKKEIENVCMFTRGDVFCDSIDILQNCKGNTFIALNHITYHVAGWYLLSWHASHYQRSVLLKRGGKKTLKLGLHKHTQLLITSEHE